MNVLIEPKQLQTLMVAEPTVVIDTRDAGAYAAGHLPGAVNPDDIQRCLSAVDPDAFDLFKPKLATTFSAAGLTGEETAVLYEGGANTGFGPACRGYLALSQLGHPRVKVLNGGYRSWLDAGLPPSVEAPCPVPSRFPADATGGVLVGKETVLAEAVERHDAVLLDVRDEDEWRGATSSPVDPEYRPRNGRIPGARWIAASRLMRPEVGGPAYKLAGEILDECLTVGITPDTPVIVYCFSGVRAASSYLLLKEAGIENVRVYYGSWDEWSRDPALPVEAGPPGRPCLRPRPA